MVPVRLILSTDVCCRVLIVVITQEQGVVVPVRLAGPGQINPATTPFMIAHIVLGDDQVVRRNVATSSDQTGVVAALAGPVLAQGWNRDRSDGLDVGRWRERACEQGGDSNLCQPWAGHFEVDAIVFQFHHFGFHGVSSG